jgi:thiol-disulfide isomerase/thioredoxin
VLNYQHKFNVNSKDEATLAAMQGKLVLIDFWATWCEPCVRTLPLLDDLQRRYPDRWLVAVRLQLPNWRKSRILLADGVCNIRSW